MSDFQMTLIAASIIVGCILLMSFSARYILRRVRVLKHPFNTLPPASDYPTGYIWLYEDDTYVIIDHLDGSKEWQVIEANEPFVDKSKQKTS